MALSKKCGFLSVYVLVDRVDETRLTGHDAGQAFLLVQSLIADLQILEVPGLAFRFFLWDHIKELYNDNGARPDRVNIFTLNWSTGELERMLAERLRAYSGGHVTSLNQLAEPGTSVDAHKLAAYLGEGSPRDMIRFCGRLIDEHTRVTADVSHFSEDTVFKVVRTFLTERSDELYASQLDQLRRIQGVNFTISQLASDVFHSSNEAVRQKVQAWMNSGAVKRIGEVENSGRRPLHLYGYSDLRLAIAMQTKIDVALFLSNIEAICLSDRNEISCTSCGGRAAFSGAASLLDLGTRPL